MHKHHYFIAFILLLILLFFATKSYPSENLQSLMLASPCAACHGPEGKSPGSIPSLSGKSPLFISMMMKAYKDDKRQSSVMNRIAKGYTNEEIEIIAKTFK